MKAILSTLILLVTFGAFSQQKNKPQSKAFSVNGKTVMVYTSADSTNLRITNTDNLKFSALKQPFETQICVFVDPNKTFQTFLGIGGAITDASAEVFAKLPQNKQQEFLNAYFSKDKGIGYSLIRTNIHSCDFSSDMYTYVAEGDADLKTFSIEHDKKFKIPLIKKATETAGGKLTLFASPWSPPAFMKDNKDMLKGGKLLPEFYQSWANYYVKFVNAYQKEGIPVWGLTVQNEPMAKQTWESCIYTAEEERDFLKNYLGPTLSKAGLGDKKITVWDHNRDLMTQRATTILDDPEANKYVWGIGFHWYETWSGGAPMFENVGAVKELYPNKNLLFTEGCNEKFDAKKYQLWTNGERYGKSMINDFNNGTVGWTDWNILLDENGGPNHVGNFCFAPIHADTKTGELIYTPSYYFIGHFSKFIGKDAKRISTVTSRSQLISTSFLNQDGKVITVVMNQSNKKVTYNLCIGTNSTEISILPNAIQTLVY
jgi:glucosylceramidase